MAGMLNLRLIFQLVIDGFDDIAFTQQQFISHEHEAVLLGTNAGNQVQSMLQESLEQGLREIAHTTEELAKQIFDQLGNGLAIIYRLGL